MALSVWWRESLTHLQRPVVGFDFSFALSAEPVHPLPRPVAGDTIDGMAVASTQASVASEQQSRSPIEAILSWFSFPFRVISIASNIRCLGCDVPCCSPPVPISCHTSASPSAYAAGTMFTGATKIVKPEGQEADEFEQTVAQELFNLEVGKDECA